MTTTLAQQRSIVSALFVRMDVPGYQVLRFSEFDRTVTIDSEDYLPLGQLLGVTSSTNELKIAPSNMTITVSGVPNTSIAEIINNRFKGSAVTVYRMILDTVDQQPVDLPVNPLIRFQGIVNNYSLEEDWTPGGTDARNTIAFICSSTVELMTNKVAGRRTNPIDENYFFPADRSMDRVPNLANSNFNFGAVIK
jgi:hypothetical protein